VRTRARKQMLVRVQSGAPTAAGVKQGSALPCGRGGATNTRVQMKIMPNGGAQAARQELSRDI